MVLTPTQPSVVIGGGVAGLAAAVRLASSGRRVIVLEARSRLGGRATAFPDRVTGALVDNGQHVLFGCYTHTLEFLRTIGAEDNVRVQPALDVPYVDARGRTSRLRCPDLPAPLHLVGGLLGWEALRWRDRWAARRVWAAALGKWGQSPFYENRKMGTVPISSLTVTDWLRQLGQTARLREWLWEPLAVAALNEPPHLADARAFAQVLALMFSDGPRHSALVLPTVPLDAMYAEPARAFIEARGGSVRVNALAKVISRGDRVEAVRVGPERIPTRAVISSVPWNNFALVFDSGGSHDPAVPALLGAIAESAAAMTSRPIVTVNLWYDRAVMDEPFVGFPNATIQWVFAKGGNAAHLSLIVSGAIELVDRTNEEILAIARRDVEERLPRARRAALQRGTVVRERHATFSTRPGASRPGPVTPLRGFYVAGDWTDTGLPSTIEGAVNSGNRAADALTSHTQ